jgi:hypothetical protein
MLLDRREIERFDASLTPEDPLVFDRKSAGLIRQMYEKWVADAESLLSRVSEVENRFGRIVEANELSYAVGKTMAMLSISLDEMEAGCRDIVEGRLHSAEEVRRELHLQVR